MTREVTIAVSQLGPCDPEIEPNVDRIVGVLDGLKDTRPDFVLFPELATTQFFALGLKEPAFFDLAETVPGPSTERIGKKAAEIGCHVVLPIFEKGPLEGQYYNSAAVLGPDGKVIPGILPDGTEIPAYRKNYISDYRWPTGENDEKYYFGVGQGYPIFETAFGKVGLLVCYDRWFPEGYKILGLRGAEIVFVPVASAGFVGDLFIAGLRTHAAENAYAVIGCNKAGVEKVVDHDESAREASYYGLSCIVDCRGQVVAQAAAEKPDLIVGTIDLDVAREVRRRLFVYRDRRPELYGIISQPVAG